MVSDAWKSLNITPTSDKKDIKRAYVKLLKLNKPDKDPEGFQQLRKAYETALALSEFAHDLQAIDIHQGDARNTELETTSNDQYTNEYVDEQDFGEEDWDEEDLWSTKAQITDPQVLKLLESVKQLLLNEDSRNKADNWEFLLESEFVMDLDQRHLISVEIFDELLTVQKSQYGKSKFFKVLNKDVVNILDNEFDWSNDVYLQSIYSDKDYFKIANRPIIVRANEPDEAAFIGYRLLASILDFGGLFILVYVGLVLYRPDLNGTYESIIESTAFQAIYLPMVFIYNVVFEFSAKRATPGKQLFKLYVNTSFGRFMPYWELATRNVIRFLAILIWMVCLSGNISDPMAIVFMFFGPLYAYSYLISAKVFRRNF
jgi:uncharacterized RDD family membrane protein YckC